MFFALLISFQIWASHSAPTGPESSVENPVHKPSFSLITNSYVKDHNTRNRRQSGVTCFDAYYYSDAPYCEEIDPRWTLTNPDSLIETYNDYYNECCGLVFTQCSELCGTSGECVNRHYCSGGTSYYWNCNPNVADVDCSIRSRCDCPDDYDFGDESPIYDPNTFVPGEPSTPHAGNCEELSRSLLQRDIVDTCAEVAVKEAIWNGNVTPFTIPGDASSTEIWDTLGEACCVYDFGPCDEICAGDGGDPSESCTGNLKCGEGNYCTIDPDFDQNTDCKEDCSCVMTSSSEVSSTTESSSATSSTSSSTGGTSPTESSTSETSPTESSTSETSSTESSTSETSSTESSTSEISKTESSTSETSSTESSTSETSSTESSTSETSSTESSTSETSSTESSTSETSSTESSTSETSSTESSTSETSSTESSTSETSSTESSASETSATESSASETSSAESTTGETSSTESSTTTDSSTPTDSDPCDDIDCDHGECRNGECICDDGYEGSECEEMTKQKCSVNNAGQKDMKCYGRTIITSRDCYDKSEDGKFDKCNSSHCCAEDTTPKEVAIFKCSTKEGPGYASKCVANGRTVDTNQHCCSREDTCPSGLKKCSSLEGGCC